MSPVEPKAYAREQVEEWVSELVSKGWFRVAVQGLSGARVRLTFLVTEEEGKRELMIAAENGGCLFVDFGLNRVNWFLFVQAGFDFSTAQAAADILISVFELCATVDAYQPDTLLLPKD